MLVVPLMELKDEVPRLLIAVSSFCVNKCKAKCCRNGLLPLTIQEQERFDKTRINDRGCYDLIGGCEFLSEDNICTAYGLRPSACKSFPYMLKNRTIYANTFCPYVDKDGSYEDSLITSEHMYIVI